jgi:hypothetical protein
MGTDVMVEQSPEGRKIQVIFINWDFVRWEAGVQQAVHKACSLDRSLDPGGVKASDDFVRRRRHNTQV